MRHASYYRAAIPENYRILGQQLLPLSIGHLTILGRVQSPFIEEEDTAIAFGDLALAVAICSMTYEEGVDFICDDKTPAFMEKWGRKLCYHPIFWWKSRGVDWEEKIALFGEYIKEGTYCPKWVISSLAASGSNEINAPTHQIIKCVLMDKLGMAESDVMNRPYSLCMWDFVTTRAVEGQLEIMDDQELASASDLANRLQAKINAS